MVLNNEFKSKLPYIGSHEPTGTIYALGPDVKDWNVGDRVGITNFESVDHTCPDCKTHRPKYCDNPLMMGITTDGTWDEYMVADARFLVAISENVPFAQATGHICAGLAIYGAILKAGVRKGTYIAIVRVGRLDHVSTQLAKAMGYAVVAVDTKNEALDPAM
ncbi:chaperonin 10-like protein [Calycina marina]|uniref:Chaperonin 10-like protein n=1 Tax=Calycina marina TaxID=1763456 RepID=A0A9P8CCK5_9HELO|nr:chaperonin 10-like protein [Calycina marina]